VRRIRPLADIVHSKYSFTYLLTYLLQRASPLLPLLLCVQCDEEKDKAATADAAGTEAAAITASKKSKDAENDVDNESSDGSLSDSDTENNTPG